MEVVLVVAALHVVEQLLQAQHRPYVNGAHLVERNGVALEVETVEVAEQEAERIAETTVGIGSALQNVIADGNVDRVVGGRDPQAQHVGAVLVDDFLGGDAVALGLRHLLAVFVNGEAAAHDALVGRLAKRARAQQKRALEPTAMLVGAFEVHIGRPTQVIGLGAVLQHAHVRHARLPPYVKDIFLGHNVSAAALRAARALGQVFLGLLREPCVGAFGVEQVDNRVEGLFGRNGLAAARALEHRNRHAPAALARDAPVGTIGNHGTNAVHAPLGDELHVVVNLVERSLAQTRIVHRDEPLVSRAENNGLMATPAMRVAVHDVDMSDERALLAQPLDDLRVGLVGGKARPLRHVIGEAAVIVNRHDGVDAELHANLVVVDAMAGSRVNGAGARVEGDMLAPDDAARVLVQNGADIRDVAELVALHGDGLAIRLNDAIALPASDLGDSLDHVLREHHELAVSLDEAVIDVGTQRHSGVRRQRPRRGGPNKHVGALEVDAGLGESSRNVVELEVHVNRRRRLVGIFDFGLGECGVAMRAPMNGLAAAVHGAIEVKLLEHFDIRALEVRLEREVRMLPIAIHAQALEVVALHVNELFCPLAAQTAHRRLRQLAHFLGAELLFDLMLNRLAVAIPTRNIRREIAALRVRLNHEVFQDLIEGMADVDRAIRIRGAIMQDEGLAIFVLLENAMIDVLFGPLLQALRLVLRKVRPHGEVGLRQIHRLLVIVSHRVLRFLSSVRVPSAESRLGQYGSREATTAFAQVFRV